MAVSALIGIPEIKFMACNDISIIPTWLCPIAIHAGRRPHANIPFLDELTTGSRIGRR